MDFPTNGSLALLILQLATLGTGIAWARAIRRTALDAQARGPLARLADDITKLQDVTETQRGQLRTIIARLGQRDRRERERGQDVEQDADDDAGAGIDYRKDPAGYLAFYERKARNGAHR